MLRKRFLTLLLLVVLLSCDKRDKQTDEIPVYQLEAFVRTEGEAMTTRVGRIVNGDYEDAKGLCDDIRDERIAFDKKMKKALGLTVPGYNAWMYLHDDQTAKIPAMKLQT
jgi:hypothetical protein